MRIIVCVKQVIDTAARIEIKDGKVDGAGLSRVLNPYDEFAVEEALKIRERKPDTTITLVSLGPEIARGGDLTVVTVSLRRADQADEDRHMAGGQN